MKKLILFAIMLVVAGNYAEAKTRQYTTVTPIGPQYYGNSIGQNQYDSYPRVTQVENFLFKRNFQTEDIYNRLDRVEQRLFNRTNSTLSLAERVDAINQTINPGNTANIPLGNLSNIENKLFNRVYTGDDPETRIIRLEKEMLGAMQQGELPERYEVINQAAKHYNAFPYENNSSGAYNNAYMRQTSIPNMVANQLYQQYSPATAKTSKIKNILGTMLGGTMTGYTPPIYNSSYYNPTSVYQGINPNNYWAQNQYPQGGYGFSDYMKTNRGYYNTAKDYGSGTGVKILYD